MCVLHASPNCRNDLCLTAKMWNVAIKSRNIGHEFTAETWGSDFPVKSLTGNSGEFGGRHDVSCCLCSLVCKFGDIKVDFENWKGHFAQHIILMFREKSHQQFAKYVFSFKSHAQKHVVCRSLKSSDKLISIGQNFIVLSLYCRCQGDFEDPLQMPKE